LTWLSARVEDLHDGYSGQSWDGGPHPHHQSNAGCLHTTGGPHGHRLATNRRRRWPICRKIIRIRKFRRKVRSFLRLILNTFLCLYFKSWEGVCECVCVCSCWLSADTYRSVSERAGGAFFGRTKAVGNLRLTERPWCWCLIHPLLLLLLEVGMPASKVTRHRRTHVLWSTEIVLNGGGGLLTVSFICSETYYKPFKSFNHLTLTLSLLL